MTNTSKLTSECLDLRVKEFSRSIGASIVKIIEDCLVMIFYCGEFRTPDHLNSEIEDRLFRLKLSNINN